MRALEGSVRFDGEEILGLEPKALNRVRGSKLTMIFQDPMTSLTPHLKIGVQLAEVLVSTAGSSWREARARGAAHAGARAHTGSRAPTAAVSARTVGRHAPAGDDRHEPDVRALAC